MSTGTIARRYSVALADVVIGAGETEMVKSELASLGVMFDTNADLHNVFSSPAISQINKENVLNELLARAKPSKTTANFLKVLLQNSRLADLREINDRFAAELDRRGGIVSAQITSARELPQAEKMEFETNLEKITGKKVNIAFDVDENLIGGVITRIGSTLYDGSVKTKLENLKEQLANGL